VVVWPQVLLALALTQAAPRFQLVWSVPCGARPDAEQIVGDASGDAVVSVTHEGSKWHLQVMLPSGVRELDAGTCEEAVEAATLILKLSFPATPVVHVPEPPPPPTPDPQALEVRVEGAVAANAGALPSVTPRFMAGFSLSSGAWSGGLTLRAGLRGFYGGPPRFAVYPALGAELSGCYLAHVRMIRIGGCAVAGVEWWRASGTGPGEEAWLELGADFRASIDVTAQLYTFGTAGPRFGLRRPQIVFDDGAPVFTAGVVSGEARVGFGWRW
jgi:hypothetical protein